MPRRAPAPCTYPGCPELVDKGRCPRHRTEDARLYHSSPEQKQRQALYTSKRWRRFRRRYLAQHSWCTVPDCPKLATDVDHRTPLTEWTGSPYDETNLQALCKKHHSEKTAREVFRRT